MRAITLTQPWATLVAIGAKKIETRSWSTSYRGPLAIHAAKGFPKPARNLCYASPFRDYLRDIITPIGAVIATCELVAVMRVENLTATHPNAWVGPSGRHYSFELDLDEQAFGDYTHGRYAWLLADVKQIEPVPAKGALSLWEWNP